VCVCVCVVCVCEREKRKIGSLKKKKKAFLPLFCCPPWDVKGYFLWSDCFHSAFDSAGESLYVSESKRLRSSSGHGGGWRTGVDFQHDGHLHTVLRVCRVHGDVTHGGPGILVL
jgi:hypothetical protein